MKYEIRMNNGDKFYTKVDCNGWPIVQCGGDYGEKMICLEIMEVDNFEPTYLNIHQVSSFHKITEEEIAEKERREHEDLVQGGTDIAVNILNSIFKPAEKQITIENKEQP